MASLAKAGLWCGLLLLASASWLGAQKALPEPTGFLVNDYAGLLGREEVVRLGEKLSAYAKETSTQIVVVTETSLEGEDAFDYSIRLAQAWGIGGSDQNDNGILVYVASDDRQVRIQTGYGAEGFLPDVLAKRIIDNIMAPAFREGRYYDGLDRATDAIMDLGRGEYTNDGEAGAGKRSKSAPVRLVLLFIIGMIVVLSLFNKRGGGDDDDDDDGGYWRGGRYDMDPRGRGRRHGGGWVIFPGFGGGFGGGGGGGSSSGGGWGGFGGGDFGGFGGGDFGGGGAGGSW